DREAGGGHDPGEDRARPGEVGAGEGDRRPAAGGAGGRAERRHGRRGDEGELVGAGRDGGAVGRGHRDVYRARAPGGGGGHDLGRGSDDEGSGGGAPEGDGGRPVEVRPRQDDGGAARGWAVGQVEGRDGGGGPRVGVVVARRGRRHAKGAGHGDVHGARGLE